MSARVLVRGLSWRPLGRRVPVLAGIDLCLQPGERVLLTGPSGSGKSTLLLALAGQLSGEDGELAGSVVVDGTVGLLLQDPTAAVVAERVGRDVAFGPENLAVPRSGIWPAVADALRVSHFPYGADRRTSALSGGESARLALAGAMALHPGLLLLDEPLAMLDGPTADQVRTAILAAAAGCTLVVVDHRTGPWLPHVDRVVRLSSSGTLVTDAPPTAPSPPALSPSGTHVTNAPPTALSPSGTHVTDAPPTALLPQSAAKQPLEPHSAARVRRGGRLSGRNQPPTAPLPEGAPRTPREAHLVAKVRSGQVLLRAEGAYGRPLGWRDEAGTGRPAPEPRPSDGGECALLDAQVLTGECGPLDAQVVAGELLLITGPSGSGKSTLLALLAGLGAPVRGEVTAAEGWAPPNQAHPHSWTSRALADRVAWVPQLPEHAVVERTVIDEVLTTGRALGRDDGPARDRAHALLEQLGLAHLAAQDPHTLSGGEQRRLGLAAALAHDPQILLLDEPTVGQDPHTWRAVAETLVQATASGTAVVVATHDDELLDRLRTTGATRTIALTRPAHPTSTRVHRWPPASTCSPTALLLAAALALVGAMQVDSPRSALVFVTAQLLLAPLAVRTLRAGLRRALPGLVAAASLGASSWWIAGNDVSTAVVAGARIFSIVLPGALLSAWVDYSRLGDELAQWWRLPARPVVASTAALQRLGELGRQWRLLERVRHVRGLGPSRWPWSRARHLAALTFALLVQTLRSSAQLAVAMDVRGFATAHQRTFAEAPVWSGRDSALVAIATALALLPWAAG